LDKGIRLEDLDAQYDKSTTLQTGAASTIIPGTNQNPADADETKNKAKDIIFSGRSVRNFRAFFIPSKRKE
jgi:formylmethanofuran dehydrogenase subunit B